ncbi:MAG: anti-sigma factor antagonist, partial [Frankiales bacterium]|nr:anti-sigma factor antagonist [Frankiales bacterium]
VRVLQAAGELDIVSVTPLLAQLDEWTAGAAGVVLDLTDVTFFDSFGVHLVDALARQASVHGAAFRIVAPKGTAVHRVLEIVGLAEQALPDRLAAVTAVRPG